MTQAIWARQTDRQLRCSLPRRGLCVERSDASRSVWASACGSMLWPTKPRTTVCGVEQVLQLQYRVRWLSDDVSVRNDAAAVTVRLAGFSCSLSGETLIAEPSADCSSVEAARAALEPALHAWEASGELNQGLRFSFKYTGSAVHDVAPASSALSRSTMWSH